MSFADIPHGYQILIAGLCALIAALALGLWLNKPGREMDGY